MSSVCRNALALALIALAVPVGAAVGRELRVCADPNNLPFSNDRLQGFENAIVDLLARDLDAEVQYTWRAQRRGFLRNTLGARACDLTAGTVAELPMLKPTTPYYRSSYVFVTRFDLPEIASLDDPALGTLRIGVHLIGDDGFNVPPAHALARRGIIENVRGFSLYGDYREPDPPARLIDAVASGEIDVAIVWGPLGGYFAKVKSPPLRVTPVRPALDGPLPMTFAISMGVRRDDEGLRQEIESALARRRLEIAQILARFGVPLAEPTQSATRPVP